MRRKFGLTVWRVGADGGLSIPVMAASPALPAAGVTEQLIPEPVPQASSFAPGATSAQVQGTLAASEMKRVRRQRKGGQTMSSRWHREPCRIPRQS